MEQYKIELKKVEKWAWLFLVLHLLVLGLLWFVLPEKEAGIGRYGATFLVAAWGQVSLMLILRNRYILRNPQVLKNHFLKEKDERNLVIEAKAGKMAAYILFGSLYFAMIFTSYLNKTVFITLLLASVFSAFVLESTKLYYRRKM